MLLSNRIRLIVLLSIILVIAFTAVSLLNVHTARTAMIEEVSKTSLPLLRENIFSEIQEDFLPALNIASMMANDYFLVRWTEDGEKNAQEVQSYLQRIQQEYDFFSTFFISDRTKKYYHFSGINKTISTEDEHDVWYFNFVDSGREYILDVDTDEVRNNLLTIFLNFRLEDHQGNLIGVTGIGIEMESFSNFLQQKQQKYDRTIFLTDAEGLIQAHSDISNIEAVNIYNEPGINVVAQKILTDRQTPLDFNYNNAGENILISSRYIPELDWFLIVELRNAEELGESSKVLKRSIEIGLLSSVLIIIIVSMMITSYNKKLESLSTTDPLTSIYNRREFDRLLHRASYRNGRHGTPFSVIIIDLDNFKNINDKQGHPAGDKVLVEFSSFLFSIKRTDDVLARWGGDEFILLLESDLRESEAFAERLRFEYRKLNYSITLSMGIAQLQREESMESLINRSDQALYRAKKNGRDQIATAG
ncbi:MAG: diguanylate cyclase [Spirochaetales bacterium]|nr:diguanylate cyclase [Spirochaetales bacterium]